MLRLYTAQEENHNLEPLRLHWWMLSSLLGCEGKSSGLCACLWKLSSLLDKCSLCHFWIMRPIYSLLHRFLDQLQIQHWWTKLYQSLTNSLKRVKWCSCQTVVWPSPKSSLWRVYLTVSRLYTTKACATHFRGNTQILHFPLSVPQIISSLKIWFKLDLETI